MLSHGLPQHRPGHLTMRRAAVLLALGLCAGLAAAHLPIGSVSAQPGPVTVTVDETVEVSDGPALLPGAIIAVDETVEVSDGPALLPGAIIAVNESVSVSDEPEGSAGVTGGGSTIGHAPAISGFSPRSGPVGDSVTITGSAFMGATALKFNSITATFTVDSAAQITATVPSGAITGPVTITTPFGTGTSPFDFAVAPRIAGFSPTSGGPGAQITITGDAFVRVGAVTFNGLRTAFTVESATQITATVPANATTGPLSVATSAGAATSAASFTVAPRIASFTPIGGSPGTRITIAGANFSRATAVTFGVNATFTVDSTTQITATVPDGATTGKIGVTTAVGTATSPSDFSVTTMPIISSFSPLGAPVGSRVIISGANFAGATLVSLNGVRATFTVDTPQQITATVPAGATTGLIAVTTSIGTATSARSFAVTTGAVLGEFEEGLPAPAERDRMPEPAIDRPPPAEMDVETAPAEEPVPELPSLAPEDSD